MHGIKLKEKNILPYVFICPAVIFILAIFMYPLILTFKYSFSDTSMLSNESSFVGIKNYISLFKNAEFIQSIKITALWTIMSLTLKIVLGTILALLLNRKVKGIKIYRVLILLSWSMPQVTSGIIWSWIYDGKYGYLNYFLMKLGLINENLIWLGEKKLAFLSTVAVDAWMGIPFIALMILSALKSIPNSIYEAADLDGASSIDKLRLITIPQIKSIVLMVTTLTTIWTFNSFNVIWVLTKGGPINSTETLPIKIYIEGFTKYNTSISCTMSVIVFSILSIFTFIYWKKFLNKNESL